MQSGIKQEIGVSSSRRSWTKCVVNPVQWALLWIVAMSGCAGATNVPSGPEWRRVEPDQVDSQQVDILSVAPHENVWSAWTQSRVFERMCPRA